jgi:hypothetical protein
MQPKHWLDPLRALITSGIHELMGSSLSSYRADRRSNFSRKSTRALEGNELYQRA